MGFTVSFPLLCANNGNKILRALSLVFAMTLTDRTIHWIAVLTHQTTFFKFLKVYFVRKRCYNKRCVTRTLLDVLLSVFLEVEKYIVSMNCDRNADEAFGCYKNKSAIQVHVFFNIELAT